MKDVATYLTGSLPNTLHPSGAVAELRSVVARCGELVERHGLYGVLAYDLSALKLQAELAVARADHRAIAQVVDFARQLLAWMESRPTAHLKLPLAEAEAPLTEAAA